MRRITVIPAHAARPVIPAHAARPVIPGDAAHPVIPGDAARPVIPAHAGIHRPDIALWPVDPGVRRDDRPQDRKTRR